MREFLIDPKRDPEQEYTIHLFEFCNLRCAFCWQNHEDTIGTENVMDKLPSVEKFISKISRSLEDLGQSEISSNTIGTLVMECLKELDPVAYVRFASVYRNFREEKDFVQFVDKIDVFKKR